MKTIARKNWAGGFALALLLAAVPAMAAPAFNQVDLALVLLVDISGSMDYQEQQVQRDGYVRAFRDPEVVNAITDGLIGKVAVTYVEWSDPWVQFQVMPWTVLDGSSSSLAFADSLAEAPIHRARSTSISSALLYAADLLDSSGFSATRRAIDVSGDGANNSGPFVVPSRDLVLARRITINGLPITLRVDAGQIIPGADIPNLDLYYRDCVIGGPNAFMFVVNRLEDFPVAIRRKLIQEIAFAPSPAKAAVQHVAARTDCFAGERARTGSFPFGGSVGGVPPVLAPPDPAAR